MAGTEPIVVVERRIAPEELARLVTLFFEDMVKYVVDVDRGVAAVGLGNASEADGAANGRFRT